MSGAIATGNPHTTEAARLILEAGGNAVDAAIAACAASFVAEPLLASAGGAGMMCLSVPGKDPIVVDFFSAMPGLGAKPHERDFQAVEIDFGSATQIFHVGRASAAAPMALRGLALTSKHFGTMPLREVVAPAVALAKSGASITPESADVFSLLWPINRLDDATATVYSDTLDAPRAGFTKAMPGQAELLTAFAAPTGAVRASAKCTFPHSPKYALSPRAPQGSVERLKPRAPSREARPFQGYSPIDWRPPAAAGVAPVRRTRLLMFYLTTRRLTSRGAGSSGTGGDFDVRQANAQRWLRAAAS